MKHVLAIGHDREPFLQLVRDLDTSKAWSIEVKPYKKTRSNAQNAYLWGVLFRMLADETGHDVQDIHDYLLGERYGWEETVVFGKKKVRPVRTLTGPEKMSRPEQEQFSEWVRSWAAQKLGMLLPLPNEGPLE